jgi:hypothetical protein
MYENGRPIGFEGLKISQNFKTTSNMNSSSKEIPQKNKQKKQQKNKKTTKQLFPKWRPAAILVFYPPRRMPT